MVPRANYTKRTLNLEFIHFCIQSISKKVTKNIINMYAKQYIAIFLKKIVEEE